MLPDIIKVAEDYGVELNPNTINKKEVLGLCPFCNHGKHKLSLNTEKKLFKCWVCNESGGVLAFESKLSGKSFNEIRAKYFGSKKRQEHPAYELSPDQLKQIGWHSQKRENYIRFAKSKEDVMKDWKRYEYEEYVKYFALFKLIENFPFQELRKIQFGWFLKEIEKSKVENIYDNILYVYKNNLEPIWKQRAIEVARVAYKTCIETNDVDFVNIYVNVLWTIEYLKIKKQ